MKKYFISAIFALMLIFNTAAAANLFPVERTGIDGVTSWGYMNDDGKQVIDFQYASATPFNNQGLAVVGSADGKVAVINENNRIVVPLRSGTAEMFSFSDDQIVFRHGSDSTEVFSISSQSLGVFGRTNGFLSDGLIAQANADGLWGYANASGTMVIPAQYTAAGGFVREHAIAQKPDNHYVVLTLTSPADSLSAVHSETPLPEGAVPVYPEIYEDDLVILSNGSRMAIYSLSSASFVTDYLYQTIAPFRDGHTMLRVNNCWGIINAKGKVTVDFVYTYLSYMGEGVYAARGADGYVSAIDNNGNLIYRTHQYAGGFDQIRYGVSWHGTTAGEVIFFSKVGGYLSRFEHAEKPTILCKNAAVLTMNGVRQYVRLSDGKVLYTPSRTYHLGELTIHTMNYEKYLGTDKNGREYGWNLTYPAISGLADKALESKINAAIETFFLRGPSFSARNTALYGGYGAELHGSVFIVWANCVSGEGEGAMIWNENVAFDLTTGKEYLIITDLFTPDYLDVVSPLLPPDVPYYLFSYPRVTATGVSYYLQNPGTALTAASVDEIALPFEKLDGCLVKSGAFWKALNTPLPTQKEEIKTDPLTADFSDVPPTHWAYKSIQAVHAASLMHGNGKGFAPERTISLSEVTATLVRLLGLDTPPKQEGEAWYVPEMAAAKQNGLLVHLPENPAPTAAIVRADTMQLFANALGKRGVKPLTAEQADTVLALFADGGKIPAGRRTAAALCVQQGLIAGNPDGTLQPDSHMTRAEFARILQVMNEMLKV